MSPTDFILNLKYEEEFDVIHNFAKHIDNYLNQKYTRSIEAGRQHNLYDQKTF